MASDLSVSGWFINALKSAKMARLHVNPVSFDGAIKFLDSVKKKEPEGSRHENHPGLSFNCRCTAIACPCHRLALADALDLFCRP